MIRDFSDTESPTATCPALSSGASTPGLPDNPALRDLRRQVADDAAVDRFITDFLTLLDERMRDLRQLIADGRAEESVTRLLSIKTSSAMVGADDLTETAEDLIQALQQGECQLVPHHYRELIRSCEQARRTLGPAAPAPGRATSPLPGHVA